MKLTLEFTKDEIAPRYRVVQCFKGWVEEA